MRRLILRAAAMSVAAMLSGVTAAHGQTPPITSATQEDHVIVFEFGWAASYSQDEGVHPKGATLAFEVTPVPDRLELEAGVTTIWARGSRETSWDLLFKKPWTISPRVEFMAGVGPEIIHSAGDGRGTFWGLSAVADFMVWPKKNVGWYLEPGYEVAFPKGTNEHGVALAAGLIIGR